MPYGNNKDHVKDDFISRNYHYFQNILGSLSDYTTKNTYADLEATLKDYGQRYNDYQNYQGVRKKILTTQLGADELGHLQTDFNIDLTDPNIQQTDAFKKFAETNPVQSNVITGKPVYDNPEYSAKFYDYIKNNYSTAGEINPDYSQYVKTSKKTPTGEDLIRARMLKAGISPEEQKLYDQFKGFDVNSYNKSLEENMLMHYPELVSQGPLGDQLAQVYSKRVKLNELTGEAPFKQNIQFHDGYMFKFDDYGNELSREKIKEENIKQFQLSSDAQLIPFSDENGNQKYGWFEPDKNANDFGQEGWKFTGVKGTQDQIDEFLQQGKYKKKVPGTGNKKSGPKVQRSYSQEEKSLASDLSKLGKLNKSLRSWNTEVDAKEVDKQMKDYGLTREEAINSLLTDEQKKARSDYEELQKSLLEYFNGDYDELNKYAEMIYSGNPKDVPSLIDEILGSSQQIEGEQNTIDNIFDDEMTGADATKIYKRKKDLFKTKAGKEYFKQKYLKKIGVK